MTTGYLDSIVKELSEAAKLVEESALLELAQAILQADRVFVAGAGRSGFVARAFSNRLMHLGRSAYFVGESTTPAIQRGDLLIIGSGSGETASLVSMAKKAVEQKAEVVGITINSRSTIAGLSKIIVTLSGIKSKSDINSDKVSIQPMGSSFEQLSLLIYDSMVLILMELTKQTNEIMYKRHTNLE